MAVRLRRGTSGRLLLGVTDSAMSSLGNLGVSVVAARLTVLPEFGLFATAMLVLILGTMAMRSAHGEVLLMKPQTPGAGTGDADRRGSTSSVLRLSLLIGGSAAAGGVLLGVVSGGPTDLALTVVVGGLSFPVLCVQDHLRWVDYSRGTGRRALVNTTLWTVTSVALMLALGWWPGNPVPGFLCLAAWGLGALPSIAYAAGRGLPVTMERPDWLRANRAPARNVFLDFALTQATSQGATLVIAALTSALEMGLIRKAQIWLGPATVATLGLLAALQPILTRRAATHGRAATIRLASVTGLVLGAVLAVFGAGLLLLPDDVAELLVGPGWDEAATFVAPLTVAAVCGVVGGCLGLALRTLGLIGRQVRWRSVLGPSSVVAIAVGTVLWGAEAGMWILAASGVVTSLVWVALLTSARHDGREAADVGLVPVA